MKVAVIQSNYVPWRGYFDFIDDVDLFVIYDDVQFSKGSWRNRNQLKTDRGLEWLTVPVRHDALGQRICDTRIDRSRNWQARHRALLERSLGDCPHFHDARALLEAQLDASHRTISELNVALLTSVCEYLRITTPVRTSTEFALTGAGTERLLRLLTAVGATTYLSGPAGQAYLDEARFREAGIALEYKQYDYAPYPQPWGTFQAAVSVLDTIANCGRGTRDLLKSRAPAVAAVRGTSVREPIAA